MISQETRALHVVKRALEAASKLLVNRADIPDPYAQVLEQITSGKIKIVKGGIA